MKTGVANTCKASGWDCHVGGRAPVLNSCVAGRVSQFRSPHCGNAVMGKTSSLQLLDAGSLPGQKKKKLYPEGMEKDQYVGLSLQGQLFTISEGEMHPPFLEKLTTPLVLSGQENMRLKYRCSL